MNTTLRHTLCIAVLLVGSGARAAEPKVIAFPADTDTPVTFTLLPAAGKTGRENPFYDNCRPQIQFSAEKERVTCTVRVPRSIDKVDPGHTAELMLNCSEKFRVREDKLGFVVCEGGRVVAEGSLK
jgi:translation elongation factor EF-Tu-like GTPase